MSCAGQKRAGSEGSGAQCRKRVFIESVLSELVLIESVLSELVLIEEEKDIHYG